MDQLFDLDMALTPLNLRPAADVSDGAADAAEPPVEMPMVDAFGECAVCMEEFMPEEGGKRVPCGHVFHDTCLMTWLSLHQSCPLCRFHVAAAGSTIAGDRRC